jgi:hypothetical protein
VLFICEQVLCPQYVVFVLRHDARVEAVRPSFQPHPLVLDAQFAVVAFNFIRLFLMLSLLLSRDSTHCFPSRSFSLFLQLLTAIFFLGLNQRAEPPAPLTLNFVAHMISISLSSPFTRNNNNALGVTTHYRHQLLVTRSAWRPTLPQ